MLAANAIYKVYFEVENKKNGTPQKVGYDTAESVVSKKTRSRLYLWITLRAMKTNNMRQLAVYLGVLFIFCMPSCDKEKDCPKGSHENITIKNNSSKVINWVTDDDPKNSTWKNSGSTEYPPITQGIMEPGSTRQVGPNLAQCWEYVYAGGIKQYYFIFSHDTVNALGWDTISGTNRGLLKRVLVDLDYLQKNNFTITYP